MNNESVTTSKVETPRDCHSSRSVKDPTSCGYQPGFHVSPRRILCVDNDVAGASLLGGILESEGYSVVLKHGPFEALQCNLSSIDLAVFDSYARDEWQRATSACKSFGGKVSYHFAKWIYLVFVSRGSNALFSMCRQRGVDLHATRHHSDVLGPKRDSRLR
jgi:hypothetical protein